MMPEAPRPAVRRSAALALAVATVLPVLLQLLPALPADAATGSAAGSARGATPLARATGATRTVTVSWQGKKRRATTRSVTVPGAGQLKLTCRPRDTMVQLTTDSRAAETQMWMAKHETKHGRPVVAVKTVRLYSYANADDPGAGGSGIRGHEGLNQKWPIENRESGYIDGLISRRPGRNQPALGAALTPATSFELTWWWSGFRQRRTKQQCRMQLTLRTAPAPYGLSWHGDRDAASGSDVRSATLPGIGTLAVTCETGRNGDQDITLRPVRTSGWSGAYVETITGEGDVDDHVDVDNYGLDPTTGLIGPIPLPSNGMLRVFYTVGSRREDLIVSSYAIGNNDHDPALNLCEVAAAPF